MGLTRRGVMECFYGPHWTFEQRLDALRLLAGNGGNQLVHGPAADERTGALWREPYPDGERERFAAMAAAAKRHGVEYVWRVSPSAPLRRESAMRLDDPAERATLAARCVEMGELGVAEILVAFDDLAPGDDAAAERYANDASPLAAAQSEVIADLAEQLAGAGMRLSVCPTAYWGVEPGAYRRRLGELVDPAIPFYWTGPYVVSGQVRAHDAALVKEQLGGRELLLWDNYPVNDWDVGMHEAQTAVPRRALLGPLTGRDPELAGVLGGYFTNGGSQYVASRPAMTTALQWARDPHGYRPEIAHAAALRAEGLDPQLLADVLPALGPGPLDHPRLHRAVRTVLEVLADPAGGSAEPARELLTELVAQARRLAAQPGELAGVLRPWTAQLAEAAEAAAIAVEVIAARARGDEPALRQASRQFRTLSIGADTPIVASGLLSAAVTFARGLCSPGAPKAW